MDSFHIKMSGLAPLTTSTYKPMRISTSCFMNPGKKASCRPLDVLFMNTLVGTALKHWGVTTLLRSLFTKLCGASLIRTKKSRKKKNTEVGFRSHGDPRRCELVCFVREGARFRQGCPSTMDTFDYSVYWNREPNQQTSGWFACAE